MAGYIAGVGCAGVGARPTASGAHYLPEWQTACFDLPMPTTDCPGSGRRATYGTTTRRMVCPVCHATTSAGLAGKRGKNVITPTHPARSK